jgi:type IV secretory pathway VirB6-like protein
MLRPLVFAGGVSLGLTVATQLLAARYGYQAALGTPDLTLGALRFYAPWRGIRWFWHWYPLHPQVYLLPLAIVLGCIVSGMVLSSLLGLWQGRQGSETVHGTARWATEQDIRRSKLDGHR